MTKIVKGIIEDIKASAKAQHEVDAENLKATKMETKAQWEEAKASPEILKQKRLEEQRERMAEAKERSAEAQKRIDAAKAARTKTTTETTEE